MVVLTSIGRLSSSSFSAFLLPSFFPWPVLSEAPGARKTTCPSVLGVTRSDTLPVCPDLVTLFSLTRQVDWDRSDRASCSITGDRTDLDRNKLSNTYTIDTEVHSHTFAYMERMWIYNYTFHGILVIQKMTR